MHGLGQIYGRDIVEKNALRPCLSVSVVQEVRMNTKEEGTHQSESPVLQKCSCFLKRPIHCRLSSDINWLKRVSQRE